MKLKSISLILTIMFMVPVYMYASHGIGGEITWKCLGGQYVFEMKFYRDCNGIPGPSQITLTTNVPGIPTIPMTLISATDISMTGDITSGNMLCKTCPTKGVGAVEEFVF